jgi:uncharacterized membrane protein
MEGEPDRNRKISTASNRSSTSNVLEIPGPANISRQNSMTSTASLVSNSSARSFSYQNFRQPKTRNTFGSIIILIGLCSLVIGICLLIFGETTSTTNNPIVTNNTNQINTNSNNNSTQSYTSPAQTIGYFMSFFGILIILIGISIIFCISSEIKPIPQHNNTLERRVSTIEIEPPLGVAETAINKPEIMITTDNFKDDVRFRRFPLALPRPTISIDESTNPNYPTEIERRPPF